MTRKIRPVAASMLAAILCAALPVEQAGAQRGGFGGVSGGGARPTGGSSMGYNRAGTSSSGGFAYGDAPRSEPTVVVTPGAAAGAPCNVAPVTVDNTPYYKCGGSWTTPALSDTGITYKQVPPPPGY